MQWFETGKIIHPHSIRASASEHPGACRGTIRTGRITLFQLDSLPGELIEVGRLHNWRTIAAEIAIAHVIGQHKYDIWFIAFRGNNLNRE